MQQRLPRDRLNNNNNSTPLSRASSGGAGGGVRSQAKLIIIALFSVGILGGFYLSPAGSLSQGRVLRATDGEEGLRLHRWEAGADKGSSQIRIPKVEEHDERHPMNKAQVILQQSHHDEITKDEMVKDSQVVQQHQEQGGEGVSKAGTEGPSGSSSGGELQQQEGGQQQQQQQQGGEQQHQQQQGVPVGGGLSDNGATALGALRGQSSDALAHAQQALAQAQAALQKRIEGVNAAGPIGTANAAGGVEAGAAVGVGAEGQANAGVAGAGASNGVGSGVQAAYGVGAGAQGSNGVVNGVGDTGVKADSGVASGVGTGVQAADGVQAHSGSASGVGTGVQGSNGVQTNTGETSGAQGDQWQANNGGAVTHTTGSLGKMGGNDDSVRAAGARGGAGSAFSNAAGGVDNVGGAGARDGSASIVGNAAGSVNNLGAVGVTSQMGAGNAAGVGNVLGTYTGVGNVGGAGVDTQASNTAAANMDAASANTANIGPSSTAGTEAKSASTEASHTPDDTVVGSGGATQAVTGTVAGCKAPGMGCGLPGDTIHTLFTSNGSPYQNFQARIMVATWKLARAMPRGEKMVYISRILHRMTPDEIMDEIPTFRVNPVQPECDKWCWFPVADRANAVKQWLTAAEADPSMIKAPWLLMLESDYVWIKPLPAPGNAYNPAVPGQSFAFDYIGPRNPHVVKMLKDKCPSCDPSLLPNSGPAPVLARFEDFKSATPIWEELSLYIETHEDIKRGLGWVREMYAWDVGVAVNQLNIQNQGHPHTPLISQPPHDHHAFNASMYHYTWGSIYKENGKEIWKFDKRFYTAAVDALKVPKLEMPPMPWREGILLHDGTPITEGLHMTLAHMLELMNKGIETLPDLSYKLNGQAQ